MNHNERRAQYHEAVKAYVVSVIAQTEEAIEKLGDSQGKYADFIAKTRRKHQDLLRKIDRKINRERKKAEDANRS